MSSDDASTASSASALARKKRVREWWWAFMAEKKTKRFTPARSAARTSRSVAIAFSSSIEPRGWSRIEAARWTTVCDAAQRVPERRRIDQVAQRYLHPHALVAEAALVAHQGAYRAAVGGEPAQERGADRSRGAREKDHGRGGYALTALGSPCSWRVPGKARRDRPPAVSTRLRPARFASKSAASAARKRTS